MTKAEAIERLENDCCKSRVYCELYPDACQKEECEIYMAIEALERMDTHQCVKPTHECDIINRDKALNLVLDVCCDVMDECETVTGNCGEEVYTDIREVDAILKCNKGIRNGIRQLPSANNSGHWTEENGKYHTAICSECGKVTMFESWGYAVRKYDFCPNCGSRMRGGNDD